MNNLFEVSTKVIKDMFENFGVIGNALMDNIIFKVIIGIVILYLLINLVFYFVKKIKQYKIDKPYKNALGMTREQFNAEMNRKYLEKFPSYAEKKKYLENLKKN